MGKRREVVQQSGVIPLVWDGGRFKAVLISPRGGRRWIIPKGNIPKWLSPKNAAEREAFEEAGVTGKVLSAPVGTYRYEKGGVRYDVTVYVFLVKKVLKRWPEMHERRRNIVKLARVEELVRHKPLRKVFRRVHRHRHTWTSEREGSGWF